MTIVTPGFVRTDFVEAVTNAEVRARLVESRDKFAISPDVIARMIVFAILRRRGSANERSDDVDVGEIVVRPTAQRSLYLN